MRSFRLRDLFMPERNTEAGQRLKTALHHILSTATSPMTVETFQTKGGHDRKSFDRYVGVVMVGDFDVADLMKGRAHDWGIEDEGIK